MAAGAAALPAVSRIAWAQAYPTRPVRLVIPFPQVVHSTPSDAVGGEDEVLARHCRG
jgi:hypothetical protein